MIHAPESILCCDPVRNGSGGAADPLEGFDNTAVSGGSSARSPRATGAPIDKYASRDRRQAELDEMESAAAAAATASSKAKPQSPKSPKASLDSVMARDRRRNEVPT